MSKHIEIKSGDDTLSATVNQGGDLTVELDKPWSGSSETGFGVTETIYLSPDQAKEQHAITDTQGYMEA